MTDNFTPGPWRIGDAGHTIFGPKGNAITIATLSDRALNAYPDNAKLIAAAPALFEVVMEVLEEWPQYDNPDTPINGGDMVEFIGEWRERALEAIAQAGVRLKFTE